MSARTRSAPVRLEHLDAPSGTGTPIVLAPSGRFTGNVGTPYDTDWVRVDLTAGRSYRFEMDGLSLADSYLELRDRRGNIVAFNDDAGRLNHSAFTYTPATSESFYLVARAYGVGTGSYTLTYDTTRPWTMEQIGNYLAKGFWADMSETPRTYETGNGRPITCDLTDLGADERAVAKMALNAWAQVSGLRFDTTSTAGSAAQIRFTNDDQAGAYCVADALVGNTVARSTVNIPLYWRDQPGEGFASYFYHTYIHEIGHALGLGHAGGYNGSATYGRDNHYANDSWQATIMSYFSQTANSSITASYGFCVTPMIADIIAIQSIYDLPRNLFAGNTMWGEGCTAGGAMGLANSLMTSRQAVTLTIVDQGGTDWLRLAGDTSAQMVNLQAGTVSNVYGRIGNLSIAQGTVIESVIAGRASDVVRGNAADNWLCGMSGNDTLYGASGHDTLDGGAGADRLSGGRGNDLYVVDGADTLIELAGEGVDRVRATVNYTLGAHFEALLLIQSFATYGVGNDQANTIVGNSQVNHLSGLGGNDTLFGMDGNDTLNGNLGADRLVGGAGDDVYIADWQDTIVEAVNGGTDTVRTSIDLVLGANLERAIATGNAAVRIVGNGQANELIGNSAANRIVGGGGNDRMIGGGGADCFVFSPGHSGRITDFADDIDLIEIRTGGSRSVTVDTVLDTARDVSGGVELTIAGGVIRIDGMTADALRDDLILV